MKSRSRQLVLFRPPPRPRRAPIFNAEQWAAIERTYISARLASEAFPDVALRDLCKMKLETGWGDKRKTLVEAFATRDNWKDVQNELQKGRPPEATVSMSWDLRPYAHRNPLYPKYPEWLAGKRPSQVAHGQPTVSVPSASGSTLAEAGGAVLTAETGDGGLRLRAGTQGAPQAGVDDLSPTGVLLGLR